MTVKKMKKAFAIMLTIAICFVQMIIIPPEIKAYAQGNFLTAQVVGGVSIIGYSDPTVTDLIIPRMIGKDYVVAIGSKAFLRFDKLKTIKIADTVASIGTNAFQECTSLVEVTIPGSVNSIGAYAFIKCTALERVNILFGVSSIGDSAFAYCTNLKTVDIAESVNDIRTLSFTRSPNVTIQADADTYAASYTTKDTYTTADENKKDLPNNSPAAYEYKSKLNSNGEVEVEIVSYKGLNKQPQVPSEINGDSVTQIGDGAFQNSGISQVTLPPTLKTIGTNAFLGTSLTYVEIPANVTGIGKNAFENASTLTLAGGVVVDDYLRANNATNIKFKPFTEGQTLFQFIKIQATNYGNISGNQSRDYRKGSTIDISAYPLYSQAKFKKWELTADLPENEKGVIADPYSSTTKYTLPVSVSNLNATITLTAVFEWEDEPDVIIENGIVKKFYQPNTTTISIPATWAESSTSSKIVNTTAIENYALINYNAQIIELPSTISRLGSDANAAMCLVNNLNSLKEIKVASGNTSYMSNDGVLFSADGKTLLRYPPAKVGQSYEIPEGVTTVAAYAFYNAGLSTIKLPSTLTSIGNYSFYNTKITFIEIPAGVTKIGEMFVSNCTELTSITVDDANQHYSDDEGVLYDFGKTLLIEYPIKKPDATYTIPSTTLALKDYAFSNRLLTTLNFEEPSSLQTIGNYAFNMARLETIQLPQSVKSIGYGAFANTSLTGKFTIPSSTTYIGEEVFVGSKNISEIAVEEGNTVFSTGRDAEGNSDGVLYKGTRLLLYPPAKQDEKYQVPTSTVTIGQYAFANTANLKEVEFEAQAGENESVTPSSVTNLEQYAFYNSAIETITFPSKLTSVTNYLLVGAKNLKKVIFPKNVTSISSYVISGASGVTEVTVHNSEAYISPYAFSGSSVKVIEGWIGSTAEVNAYYGYPNAKFKPLDKITKGLVIENGKLVDFVPDPTDEEYQTTKAVVLSPDINATPLSTIGENAFSGAEISSIKIPLSVKRLDGHSFNNIVGLKEIYIPRSVNSVGSLLFYGCNELGKITVDKNNTTFADDKGVLINKSAKSLLEVPHAFTGIDGKYTVPSTVKTIESSAFVGATGITELVIRDIPRIGVNAFKGSFVSPTSVSITLEGDVQEIDNGAFEDCTGVTSINIPANVQRIGFNALGGMKNLKEIKVDLGNSEYVDVDGVFYSKDKKVLLTYPMGKAETHVANLAPETEEIYSHAFYGNDVIRSISLPENLIQIGPYAFAFNTNLNSVKLPDSLVHIRNNAFQNCIKLQNITIPANVETLDTNAFITCDIRMVTVLSQADKTKFNTYYDEATQTFKQNIGALYRVFDERLDHGEKVMVLRGHLNSNAQKYAQERSQFIEFRLLSNKFVEKYNVSVAEMQNGTLTATPSTDVFKDELVTIEIRADEGYHFKAGSLKYTYVLNGVPQTFSITDENLETTEEPQQDEANRISTFAADNSVVLLRNTFLMPQHDVVISAEFESDFAITSSGVVSYVGEGGPVVIPETINGITVTSIAEGAFKTQKGSLITSVVIPSTVTEIGASAFEGCEQLKNVTFTEGSQLKTIGNMAFYGCNKLPSIELQENTSQIGEKAFMGCLALVSFKVGGEIVEIKDDVFNGCINLETAILPETVTSIGERAFSNCVKLSTIKAPTETESFTRVLALPNNVVSVGSEAFKNCELMRSISIPSSLETIGASAFEYCTRVTTVKIADDSKLAAIGQRAFFGCYYGAIYSVGNASDTFVDLLKHSGSNIIFDNIVRTVVEVEQEQLGTEEV